MTEEGITDLDQYHNCPGAPLVPDFFLGDEYPVPEAYNTDSVSVNNVNFFLSSLTSN